MLFFFFFLFFNVFLTCLIFSSTKRCQEYGHLEADCPQPIPVCYRCQKMGHFAKDCPMKKGRCGTCGHNLPEHESDCPVLTKKPGSPTSQQQMPSQTQSAPIQCKQ